MAKNIHALAERLGAKVVCQVPDVGGGAFGAARLAHLIEALQARSKPDNERHPEPPNDAKRMRHPKVPMSPSTEKRLAHLARQASAGGHKVSAMQLAARILEEALAGVPES